MTLKPRPFWLILLAWLVLQPGLGLAQQTLTLGVFAYRPEAIVVRQYQPLAEYLASRLPGTDVRLAVLDDAALADALKHKRIDLLLSNPSLYMDLRYQNKLTGVLATVIRDENGYRTHSLGGVIVRRAERHDLQTVRQLRGKRIATAGPSFLGGYQSQALILQ